MQTIIHYVVPYLNVNNMLRISEACKHDAWDTYWYYYRQQFPKSEQMYLDKLKATFYNNSQRTISAHSIAKNWSQFTLQDQFQMYSTRNTILLYFIAIILRNGKSIVYKYNKFVNNMITHNRYEKRVKLNWMLSSWQVLKGSRNDIFRRQTLSVK